MSKCSATLLDLLSQRAQQIRMSALIEKTRLEIIDPYIELDPSGNPWTPFALNMRRKAEILKYQKNSGSGVGNTQITRASKWANAVRNRSTGAKPTNTQCPEKIVGPLPVGRSNVPSGGDTEFLFYDESAPLYNFTNPINDRVYDTQNLQPQNTDAVVVIDFDPNVTIPTQSVARIVTFMFTRSAPVIRTAVGVHRIPIVLSFSGTTAQYRNASTSKNIAVTIIPEVCYNGYVLAQPSNSPSISTTWTSVALTFPRSEIDGANHNFTIKKCIGYLTVVNFSVDSSPMTVYTIQLRATVVFNTETFYSDKLTASVTANVPGTFADIDDSAGKAILTVTGQPVTRPILSAEFLLQ
jgi:hypothetical protein